MSSSVCSNRQESSRFDSRGAGDSFAIGVLVMLLISVVQRSIGLIRGVGFCHFLSDVELGQWALTNSFFVVGVPIAVLGLPGSFGKFSEYYRSRGKLGQFCFRIAVASSIGLVISCAMILLFPQQFSWLIYGRSQTLPLIAACVIAFASVAFFSFVNELVGSLRLVRVVSLMQFAQSSLFAVIGLSALAYFRTWEVLIPAFALASMMATLPGVFALWKQHGDDLRNVEAEQDLKIWQRILPYAGALWVLNLIGNLFEVSDRYMLLHLNVGDELVGQALVGQYHAGYILPNLLTSLATMLCGVLLPYLSADWEAGRHEQIGKRMRQVLVSVSLGYTALAVAAMSVAPLLYDIVFEGRYEMARQVLPLSLLQATWVSLYFVCQSYMLCAERGKRLISLLFVSLGLNLLLNWLFIQRWGLAGALMATSTANLVVLIALLWQLRRHGVQLGLGTVVLCFSTVSIVGGPIVATAVLLVFMIVAGRTEWLLSAEDRLAIDQAVLPYVSRVGIKFRTLWG